MESWVLGIIYFAFVVIFGGIGAGITITFLGDRKKYPLDSELGNWTIFLIGTGILILSMIPLIKLIQLMIG